MIKFAVIGDPIAHSLSPAMQNAGIKALGLDAEYFAEHVRHDDLKEFTEQARRGLAGFNITVPHKNAIFPFLDHISKEAQVAGSVNTVTVKSGRLYGDTTDGYGLAQALKEAFQFDVRGGRIAFIGCGGAAHAAAAYFASQGAQALHLINRTVAKADELAEKLRGAYGTDVRTCAIDDNAQISEFLNASDVVIQCTSLGLTPDYTGTVLVFGAGMNGIGAAQIIRIKSPNAKIIIAEPHPYRQEIAKHYANFVITPDEAGIKKLEELTNGKKADKIIECSGNPAVPGILYKFIKDGGWTDDDEPGYIHLNGDYPEKLLFDHYHRWFVKNVNMSMTCAMKWRAKGQILQWISEGKIDTTHLPYEIWPAGKAKEAFEYQSEKGMNCFKVLFDWRDL